MRNKPKYLPITELLEEIIDNRGKSVPTASEGTPLIATNCIKHTSIYPTFEKIRYVDDKTLKTWFRAHIRPNDILFVNKGTPGRVCLVPNPVNFCVAQDMIAFRCDKNAINYKYLFTVLRSKEVQKKIENYHVGLVIPHFRKQDLPSLLIPIKSPEEQEAIGELYISLSKKIELNQRINAELESLAKTIYDYWFVQFDFPNEKGKPYKSSGGKMVWNDKLKRNIPLGWNNGVFSDIGLITGGSTPPREIDEYFDINGTPWITPKDLSLNIEKKFITRGEIGVSEQGLKAASLTIMPKGTILFSSRAPIGYRAIARENVTTNQGFKSFIPNKEYTIPFIYYTVKNAIPTIIKYSSGSTFKEISGSVLKSIPICLPPISITKKFENEVDAFIKKQDILELESQTLTELRDWLLPMLMNGQVKVK